MNPLCVFFHFSILKQNYKSPSSFSQSGYVGIHMRTHTGARPYVCQTCGKAFAGSNTLAIHMRIHTGEKPYCCNLCGKAFSRHETLVIHTRSHTGDKPHVCSVCNKGFTSSGHLSGHMRTHTGVKPHACPVCNKRYGLLVWFLEFLIWKCNLERFTQDIHVLLWNPSSFKLQKQLWHWELLFDILYSNCLYDLATPIKHHLLFWKS